MRISGRDPDALQKRAIQEGIPYQTLIASVLHKYVSGRLSEEAPQRFPDSLSRDPTPRRFFAGWTALSAARG
jgi:anti-sigma factor RsiW